MRKNLYKKITASVLSLTMIVGMTGVVSAAHAANGANVAAGKTWTSFSVCTREDGGEWEDALKKVDVKDENGNVIRQQTKGQDYATEGWITSDYGNTGLTASTMNGGFRYFVVNTGWDGEYSKMTNELVADNPWGMTATLENVPIELGREYTISFQIKSTLKGKKTVKDAAGNVVKDAAGKDVTEPNTIKHISFKAYDPVSPGGPAVEFRTISGATTSGVIELNSEKDWQTITAKIQIPETKKQYAADFLGIKFALGANIVSYPDEIALSGDILVKDFKIVAGDQYEVKFVNGSTSISKYVNNGGKVTAETSFTKKGYTLNGFKNKATGATYNFNSAVTSNLTLEPIWKKTTVAKAKISKTKSAKKKVTVTIKKISAANGYQVQYSAKKNMKSTKKKTTTKTKYTIKKLKSKSYVYVKVRAYALDSTGSKVYGKLSAKKKVYVK